MSEVVTALGRSLPANDWIGIHGDTILLVLHDYRVSPFNTTNIPLPIQALQSATGLQAVHVGQVCARLQQLGYVEMPGPAMYRITQLGADFTHTTPAIITRLQASGSFG